MTKSHKLVGINLLGDEINEIQLISFGYNNLNYKISHMIMRYLFLHPIFMKIDLSSSKLQNLSSVLSLVTRYFSHCQSLKRNLLSVSTMRSRTY